MSNKLAIVVNSPDFFLSHRLAIALAAQKDGWDVHIVSADGKAVDRIIRYGFSHNEIPFSRSGQNPLCELKTLFYLFFTLKNIKPDVVHLVTIKPVLYGGIVARVMGIKGVVAAISGMGTIFISQGFSSKIRRSLVFGFYRLALGSHNQKIIFQNGSDRDKLVELCNVPIHKVVMIRGSGVDLKMYPFMPEPDGVIIVVLVARLLKDKGVLEFIEAARLLGERNVPVKMRIIGDIDKGNPTSITERELDSFRSIPNIEVLGFRKDVAEQYARSHIACLPSYREGLPKCLIEAAACGRAVVTTDVPGCRDAVVPDITGLLVPPKNSTALADAIQFLIKNPEKRKKMGMEGRKLAEQEFRIESVVSQHLRIYRELLD